MRLISRLCVGMSHLREHKFKQNFQDCLNPICSCGLDIESTSHFLLHCPSFNDERHTLQIFFLTNPVIWQHIISSRKKTRLILTQQLNIFYPLKDSRSVLFSKFLSNH